MNIRISLSLGAVAVLYFTANFSAQTKKDTLSKENKIDEVVVIGYGTQKKSNVTGAISSVRAKDIEDIPSGKPEQVLQGRAAGVSVVTNSGQPGAAATVRVRGVTSFGAGSNDPLWVVDGIVVDNIGWLNQSDIENIEILKDGASSAIYGVSAAKGVILVTTKKGRKGKMNLSYNGFYGLSSAAKKLDLLNASQYGMIINEALTNGGQPAKFTNPQSFGTGTDWQKEIFNTAERTSHEFSVSGGNDKSTFYSSFGYYEQDGIVLKDISNYKRMNVRLNSTHKVFDFLTIGQTLTYTHQKNKGVNANDEFGGPLSSAINLDPITPVVATDPNLLNTGPYNNAELSPYLIRDPFGNPYGVSTIVENEMTNPLAYRQTQLGKYNWSDDFVASVFAELKFLDHFTFKTALNGKLSYWGKEQFTPKFYLNTNARNTVFNSFLRESNKKLEWNTENTLTYDNKWGSHHLSVLIGQGAYFYNIGSGSTATFTNLPVNNFEDASFNFDVPAENRLATAYDGVETHKASYFARVIYDYEDKYLFTGTIRRDGSSKFAGNRHWGNFPAFSLGWNISNENFWPENKIVNNLKFRGGYGVLGNDAMENFRFVSSLKSGSNYTFGDNNIIIGYAPTTLENPDLRWEETSQLNVAADLKILNDFTLTVDWYKKKTTDILRQVDIPGYVGVPDRPWKNVGDMNNTGIEINLGYKKTWSDFGISINGNFSYLKNEVTRLEDNKLFENFAGFQSMGNVTRFQVGSPYGAFFGYKNVGIFQTQAEIDAYRNANGDLIQPNAKPGDFKRLDINGDGRINQEDYEYLGSSVPKFNYGLTLNLNYKNVDLMIFAQGQGGNKIFQGLRRLDLFYANYQTTILDRWTGPGTSNTVARLDVNDRNENYTKMSDYYLQKGDFVRIKLIQLGYTLPTEVSKKFGASKVRFYVTGENLFTFTKYTGYDPEIAVNDSYGIDRAYYPQARTFLFGANIQF
ncbi:MULTISPECIES: SusC/RagA family TonB-linked outer membrane protein [unclassified Chryseobacterium]|uniref:SusC/RagA family TonB-linked outer membrane protein n=1 Tax=unclassified Chryseobacterium TaxID=2593645 RepID=UPI00100AA3B9|nr:MULTISPECIES: TonB-dependent receptor [unclassified Chryseobacterium]RXM53115.1 SusC/RagA family TonB-linked outer membrane protein [Chryseobacterium sp. CH25]RXM65691.1 SusC/RagA family TonB-linked outer membrane protein [Chryseobacterium sp. CH1]